ncbi:MAG TPA: amidohydrolase family protein [Methanoregulaceae archaeon]|nr:amidohydrolase family protein [Methanoregulaceae archaeon]HPD74772.1 amidohydrolase family protein [Methanoregulaceae archaeon]HRY74665.1 amidohydrolase family protein [Methanoregulaceae archaeon]
MSAEEPLVISGHAIVGEELVPVPADIVIKGGTIVAIEDAKNVPARWICPAFFNAHTHLGDTIAMDCAVTGDLTAMVTPPDGLKHRYLKAASYADLVSGMKKSIRFMAARGTAGCADFREGGNDGVSALKRAVAGQQFRPVILGRDGGEAVADGVGISSTRDVPDSGKIAAAMKSAGKLVAIHAGERDNLDVDEALSCDPDLIVHATHASYDQLRQCAERDIPLAICPQSNWIFSVAGSRNHPPVRRMLDLGCRVFLGTDNVMFVQPDMLAAMGFLHTVYHLDPPDILRMAVAGSSLGKDPFFINPRARANFIIVNPRRSNLAFSKDPVATMVKRGYSVCSCKKVFNL